MRVIVLGGGVIGVTTAYYLAREGHEVEVVERQSRLAQDASSGNAGLIAPGHSFSWASPAAPRMLLESLGGAHTAIRVRPRLDPELIRWGVKFLRECPRSRAQANTVVKLELCQYSEKALTELISEEGIALGHVSPGILYIYRDEAELQVGFMKSELLRRHGQDQEILDASGVVAREPALAPVRHRIAGAVLGKSDSSGDCERFTNELARRCERLGVGFRKGTAAHRFEVVGEEVTGVVTDVGPLQADLYVLSLGIRQSGASPDCRPAFADVPGQGIFGHVPDSRWTHAAYLRRNRRADPRRMDKLR